MRIHRTWSGRAGARRGAGTWALTTLMLLGCACLGARAAPEVQGAQKAMEQIAAAPAPGPSQPGSQLVLQGAEKIVEAITKALASPPVKDAPETSSQLSAQLKRDALEFVANRTNMPPDQAAARWLKLYDRFWALPTDESNGSRGYHGVSSLDSDATPGIDLQGIVEALPAPGAWHALADLVDKRDVKGPSVREDCLRLLAYYLDGDIDKLEAAYKSLDAQVRKQENRGQEWADELLLRLSAGVQRRVQSIRPEGVVETFRRSVAGQAESTAPDIRIVIPDLVALAGTEEAKRLVDQTLQIPNVSVAVPVGKDTRVLVQQMALERIDKLAKPQWELVCSTEAVSVQLFEAIQKKFSVKEKAESPRVATPFVDFRSNSSRHESDEAERAAAYWYLHGLLVQNQLSNAVAFAVAHTPQELAVPYWMHGRAPAGVDPAVLFQFYGAVVKQKPAWESYWRSYLDTAADVGKLEDVTREIEHAAAAPDLPSEARSSMRSTLTRAYLESGQIDRAVALLREDLATNKTVKADADWPAVQEPRVRAAPQLANLGRLLQRSEWVREGVDAAIRALALGRQDVSMSFYQTRECVELLEKSGDYARAESLVLQAIAAKPRPESVSRRHRYYASSEGFREELSELVRIYHACGRQDDALALLEKAPWWGATDLAQLDSGLHTIAAEALHAAGRDAEAARILTTHLLAYPGDDAAYKVLVAIRGAALLPWLDELYARDRFEERPLIWKAWLLMKANRLDEAETTVREALKVDPTDGEEPAGDRVRGYAVLGDILEAREKKEDATFFRNVVQSVRLAEQGDELTGAGLIRQSLPFYQKAEALFADAYCVQWRLAERLSAMGDHAAAEEHYKIAFQRMPEQFGQVASLCFGCEGVFAGQQSRSVAERVLSDLEKQGPKRPQVYYLLGQLRDAQGRAGEAYAYYLKAVAMDPGYLDAWSKISGLMSELWLPQAEQDELTLRMLRMDPLGRHVGTRTETVYDPKGVWLAMEENRKYATPTPKSLLPLPASKTAIQGAAGEGDPAAAEWMESRVYYEGRRIPSPGAAIAGNEFVAGLLQLMTYRF